MCLSIRHGCLACHSGDRYHGYATYEAAVYSLARCSPSTRHHAGSRGAGTAPSDGTGTVRLGRLLFPLSPPPPFGFSVTCSKRHPRSRRRNLSGFSASRGRSVGDRAPGLLGTPCPVSSLPSSALAARPSLCRLAASACLVRVTCPHTAEG